MTESKIITFRIDVETINKMPPADKHAERTRTDFIREAIEEKLQREGVAAK